ncbi:MAG TPA: tRNA preQ1(34) S-adenosylmethionine ribosyltransferase-isomerase QueA [Bacteroidales bacterium]|nr:tRNA preQ1(34) S-adenosylmethionine ribosyltransferase-isomerase QueA [Bacteroidales bacterium]
MKLSQYGFKLPEELIAMYPAKHRDESKLMVVEKKTGKISHHLFKELIDFFDPYDLLIFNNTKVFPARLYGIKEKTGARIEVFLLRELSQESKMWDVLVDPARKIRIGNKLFFGKNNDLVAEVIDNTTSRGRTIRFHFTGTYEEFKKKLYQLGEPPIPKFIERPVEKIDEERYQTIFAKHIGAVAAPSAGMHFSRELLKRLEIKGVEFTEITLHAGIGNFREINVEDLKKHKIDSEEMILSEETAAIINKKLDEGRNICAVGTTVLRAIETPTTTTRRVTPFEGWTSKFIQPPYEVKIPTSMITNMHFPYSLMVVNVSAFVGYELLMAAYKEAVKNKYRFGTYGDAMLILG